MTSILALVLLTMTGCIHKLFMASPEELFIERELAAPGWDANGLYDICKRWAQVSFDDGDPVVLENPEAGSMLVSGFIYPALFLLPEKTYFTALFAVSNGNIVAKFFNIYTIEEADEGPERIDFFTKRELKAINSSIDKLMLDLNGNLGPGATE